MIGPWLFAAAAPSIVDALIRAVLIAEAGRNGDDAATVPVDRWIVLIPAREEGENIRPTLDSVRSAILRMDSVDGLLPVDRRDLSAKHLTKDDQAVPDEVKHRVVVILDGDDPVAEGVARDLGAEVLTKSPGGPTKAAALAWAAERLFSDVRAGQIDAVLVLDVGSRLEEDFFRNFRWKSGSDAMQSMISGSGSGAGDAAAISERVAQSGEDAGRERLGWAVRLRGTGTAFRPSVLGEIAPLLRTQVEDLESSLLLASSGRTLTMSGARIFDEKPEDVNQAAVQRARWFAGKLQVLSRHPDAIVRLIQRNPAEGVAFVCEVLGRPLALSALLRCAAAGALIAEGRNSWRVALAGVALGSVAVDVVVHARQGASVESGVKILGAWVGALTMVPRSLARWMRARKS